MRAFGSLAFQPSRAKTLIYLEEHDPPEAVSSAENSLLEVIT
jgi:hypothetical protein